MTGGTPYGARCIKRWSPDLLDSRNMDEWCQRGSVGLRVPLPPSGKAHARADRLVDSAVAWRARTRRRALGRRAGAQQTGRRINRPAPAAIAPLIALQGERTGGVWRFKKKAGAATGTTCRQAIAAVPKRPAMAGDTNTAAAPAAAATQAGVSAMTGWARNAAKLANPGPPPRPTSITQGRRGWATTRCSSPATVPKTALAASGAATPACAAPEARAPAVSADVNPSQPDAWQASRPGGGAGS